MLLLSGCAPRKVKAPAEIVVKRECMEAVSLGDNAECRTKVDDKVLHCTGFVLTKKTGCEVLEVKSKGEKP